MRITSPHNPTVKYVRSLERASVRRSERAYSVEGVRLVRDALASGQRATHVFYDPSLLQRTAEGSSLIPQLEGWASEVYEVDGRVLRAVADTDTPAGIVAVMRRGDDPPLSHVARSPFGVVLDGVSDPGNAGTIVRTAAAAGADYVIATPGTVDLYAPKVVRAGMGGHFRLALISVPDWDTLRSVFSEIAVIACDMSAPCSVYEVSWPCPMALVIGSEAHGLSEEARTLVHSTVRIPMRPGVESLNASVAAAIVIYTVLGRKIESDEARYR